MTRIPSLFAGPGRIAPSVDKGWRDDFILELRLLHVPGDEIGAELMTVETHVAESGEPAVQGFGEPRPYAREIAEATGPVGHGSRVGPATIAGNALGLIGMLVSMQAFTGWLASGPVDITTGELVGVGVLLLLAGTLFFTRTLRVVVEHPWLAALLPALLIGVFVGIFLLLSEPLATVPTLPMGAVGVLLLVVGAAVNWADLRHDASGITAPGEAPNDGRRGRLLGVFVMPLMTVLHLAFTWIMHALTA